MANKDKIGPGSVVVIQGGTYDGHGAKVCKINRATGIAEVIIAGRVVRLKLARLGVADE